MGGNQDSAPQPAIPSIFAQVDDAALRATVEPFASKINDAQAGLRLVDGKLGALGAGTDPAYTTTDDHFQGMSHQDLYNAVNGVNGLGGLDPRGLQTMRQTWFECASELENLSGFTLALGMNNIFGHGLWTGGAADAAKTASDRYAQVANQIGQVFDSVASRIEGAAWAAEAVRKSVQPPPGQVNLVPNGDDPAQALLPGLPNPQVTDQADAARERARQDAIRALDSIYTPSFPPAGANVPAYLDVPKETGGDTNFPSGPVGTSNGPTSPASGPTPGMEPQTGDQPSGPTDSSSAGPNPAAPSVPSLPQGAHPGTGQDAATTAAGMGPMVDSGSAGSGSGFGPGSGSGGAGTQSGGPGYARAPQPGFGMPGMVPPGAGGIAARGVAVPQGNSRPGSMPHLPHGQRKEGEEDREHRTPDYLKRVQSEWTEGLEAPVEVIGIDLSSGDEFGAPTTAADYGDTMPFPAGQEYKAPTYHHRFASDAPPPRPTPVENYSQFSSHFAEKSSATQPVQPTQPVGEAPSPVEHDSLARVQGAASGGSALAAPEPAPTEPALPQMENPGTSDVASGESADDGEPVIIDLSGTGPIIDDDPLPDSKR
ncbi:hypothetical protein AB0L57_29640 [Nocardia sp. NPDC052254]|uniref:hypothetical protein n=1 Tax=Nocardia sp. NPDC052254 TaxID=3155681 RepID=UPI00343E66E1